MKPISAVTLTLLFALLCTCGRAQNTIKGQLQDADEQAVPFANVALYADSNLVKVETTDDAGVFLMRDVADGPYTLIATYLGCLSIPRYRPSFCRANPSVITTSAGLPCGLKSTLILPGRNLKSPRNCQRCTPANQSCPQTEAKNAR